MDESRNTPVTIVHVDDIADDRMLAERTLRAEFGAGMRFIEVGDADSLAAALQGDYDALVTDYRIRFADGLEVTRRAKALHPERPVIMFTGTGTQETAVEGMKAGLDDYVTKSPSHYVRLPVAVRLALEREASRRKAAEAAEQLRLQREKTLEQAEAARIAAERANREKDELIAMLGHEVRNPLAAISNAGYLLEHSRKEEDASRARSIIRRQVDTLRALIDDLLDTTRMRTGKLKLAPEAVDLAACVEQGLSDYSAELARHTVKITAQAVWVMADPKRVHQVILNLLSNAARYTPPGGTIEVRVGEYEGQAFMEVIDSGMGMTPEVIRHAFDLFYQANKSMDRHGVGLGIGLAVVKSLVELHQGTVELRSEGPDKGTAVMVSLPCIDRPPDAPPVQPPGALRSLRVLIIEDNSDGRESLQKILLLQGHEVSVALDGREGVQAAIKLQPEVLIIDIGLPLLNGYEVAQQVRAALGNAPVLIALSGYAQQEDRQRAMEAGFDGFAAKPISPPELNEVIAGALRGRG